MAVPQRASRPFLARLAPVGDGLEDTHLDEVIQPLALTEEVIDDDVAFLASLTSRDYAEEGHDAGAPARDIPYEAPAA